MTLSERKILWRNFLICGIYATRNKRVAVQNYFADGSVSVVGDSDFDRSSRIDATYFRFRQSGIWSLIQHNRELIVDDIAMNFKVISGMLNRNRIVPDLVKNGHQNFSTS